MFRAIVGGRHAFEEFFMTRTTALPKSAAVRALVDQSMTGIGSQPSAAQLAACIFDLRRALVETLLREPAPSHGTEAERADLPELNPMELDSAQEDILRDSLPPLPVPAGPYVPVFSAWRSGIAAILGLIVLSAMAQGLALPEAIRLLLGMAGVGVALWLAEALAQARAQGAVHWGKRRVRWKTLGRLGRIVWGAALVLTLLRDFLQQNPALSDILSALTAFLQDGPLALVQNMYWLLALLALFALTIRKTIRLDTDEYRVRLLLGAQIWWDGALLLRDGILARHEATHGKQSLLRQKAAQEVCSFAAELPSAQAFWLRERLHMLGFSTAAHGEAAPTGELRWHSGLAAEYDVVGYVQEGDRCYVDTPPLLEGEQVLRKGSLRKVRT